MLATVITVLISVFAAMVLGFRTPGIPYSIKFGIVFGMYTSLFVIMGLSLLEVVKITKRHYIFEHTAMTEELPKDASMLRCMAKTSLGMLEKVIIYISYTIVAVAALWILGTVVVAISPTLATINEILDLIFWWVYTVQVWVLSIGAYSTMDWLHFYLFVLAILLTYTVLVLFFFLALFALFLALFAIVISTAISESKVYEAYLKYRKWLEEGLLK